MLKFSQREKEATMDIRDDLAKRLHELAQQQNRSVDEVLEELLSPYQSQSLSAENSDIPPQGTAARMIYEAQRAGFRSGQTDTAERSREILHNEFAKHLLKHIS
jgi:hypothetical protein